MKLYSHNHLERINLGKYAYQNLEVIPHENIFSKADTYYVSTSEFDKMVKQANLFAIIKGIKPVKLVYKRTYKNETTGKVVWIN